MILTSVMPGGVRVRSLSTVLDTVTGVRWIGRQEITTMLADLDFVEIKQDLGGLSQTVSARKG